MGRRECLLYGERMRVRTLDSEDRAPGAHEEKTKPVAEWVCPECNHFEEVEEILK